MSKHDKFCPATPQSDGGIFWMEGRQCLCAVVRAIRADEREQAAQRVRSVLAEWNHLPSTFGGEESMAAKVITAARGEDTTNA